MLVQTKQEKAADNFFFKENNTNDKNVSFSYIFQSFTVCALSLKCISNVTDISCIFRGRDFPFELAIFSLP